MPTTVVGLFRTPDVADDVIREIEALGIPRQEVHTVTEPLSFEVTGVMSFPRIDFEVHMSRELLRIGATTGETQTYVDGLRRGGTLILATGSDEKVSAAGDVMSRYGATGIEENPGPEPQIPGVFHPNLAPTADSTVQSGRIRHPGGGACCFVW